MLDVYVVDRTQYDDCYLKWADQVLPDKELLWLRRLRDDRNRIMATGDRMVLRALLSMFTIATPKRLSIQRGPAGKPYLEGVQLHFNISHSENLLAIALSNVPVGVDVERIDPSREVLEIARSVFYEDELGWLESMSFTCRARKFTELWSLKEAHLKRLGVGIAGGLARLKRVRSGERFILESKDAPANYLSMIYGKHTLALSTTCSQLPRLHSLTLMTERAIPALHQTRLSQAWFSHDIRYVCHAKASA